MNLSSFEKIFSAGEVIFRQGEAADRLCLLQKGKISLVKTRGNKRALEKIITDGSFFGLEEFLLGSPWENEAAALEESAVLQLPRQLAEAYLFANPKFLFDLVQFLANRNRALEKAAHFSKKSEGGRLAGALWLAFSENGQADVRLTLEETKEILCAATGLPYGVVADFLTELERLEILGQSEKGLFLKSSEKLFRYAEYLEDKEHFG